MFDFLEKNAEAILTRALQNGGDLAEIYFEEREATMAGFEDNKAERINSGSDRGAGVRLLSGERTLYAYTNDLTLDGFLQVADTVADGLSGAEKAPPNFAFNSARHAQPVEKPPSEMSTTDKLELIREANAAARDVDARVRQVAITYGDSLKRVIIVNSQGVFVEDVRPQIIFMVQAVAAGGSTIQTGRRTAGGVMGLELFDQCPPARLAREAAEQARLMLGADPAPTGRMPVVLSSEAGGTMIHEAVGHGLEADHIDKGMSKYCGRMGEEIATPAVTVVDDGALAQRRGTCNVDDEGTVMQRTVLIDRGVLVAFMNDLRTARKLGHAPTGNGRRESYQHKPVPRMTNTLIEPGNDDPAGILASTDHGLFVRRMGGGQVNPLNGDYVFEVSEGYLIKDGKAETPVRSATLVGNGPETLMNIDGVGSDLGFDIGTCGKAGQGVPVSDAQPTLRVTELTVGGTADK